MHKQNENITNEKETRKMSETEIMQLKNIVTKFKNSLEEDQQ